jgi:CHAT domain-containing protein/Tfp pilus assembly protein PilF
MMRATCLSGTFTTVAALLVVLSPAASEPRRQDVTPLDSNGALERQVAIGEEHLYRVTLAAGECATVIVEQRGIDVIVRARREGGTDDVEFQEEVRPNGQEQVDVVAEKSGTYILAIATSHGIYSGTYAIRAVTRRAATDADRSMYEARRLRTSGLGLAKAARFTDARQSFERAITISEAVRGPDNAFTGMVLHDIVGGALDMREFATAETLQRRALAIFAKSWGQGHPYAAMAQLRLAMLLLHAGQGAKAEALATSATEVIEKTLGTEHAWFATCLRSQASLRYNARDLDAAEAIYRRAMAIQEKVGDTESTAYTAVLNNLGLVYAERRDLARAEEHYRRALALAEVLEGPEGYHISLYLQNLSTLARERKAFATALEYATRALSIRQSFVGAEHVDIAPLLNNLAIVYRAIGDVPRATEMFLRSLHIWEKAVGPYHRSTLLAVGNLAQLYWDTGEVSRAIPLQRRADAIVEKQLELNLAIGSERQKLAFLKNISERTDRTISLHLHAAPGDTDAGALAALVVLQRKGRVLDAMTDAFSAVRRRVDDGGGRSLLDQLNSTTTRLARLALSAADDGAADQRQRAIGELEAEKERLEAELGTYSGELRSQIQPVTLEAVQSALPEDAALLEFAIFRPFDPAIEVNADAYGPPHYAAYVVRKHPAPRGVDLGPASAIDQAVARLRQALRDRTRTDVNAHARAVYDVLLRPLRTAYGDASRLLISPDGALNLVPFEALVEGQGEGQGEEQGRYLIERFSISYLSSGRDLLRLQVPRVHRSPAVIVADPDYGEPALAAAIPAGRRQPSTRAPYPSVTTATDRAALYFAPLANTAAEAHAIKRLFPDAVLLTGQRATKSAFARLDGPRMLHIASHGFFLEDGAREGAPAPAAAAGARVSDVSTTIENPLLRSGIALAGANLGHGLRGDGILTALEASGLNLWGTKLVTLSACDTGVGEVRNGEGVYGLRRAFLLAGPETLVMSLWPVSDYIARQTMVTYYAGLRAGLGRGEALRQAKLAILKRKARQHPFYWASFIQSGEWASLDGTR